MMDRWTISWGKQIYGNPKEILRDGCPVGSTDGWGSNGGDGEMTGHSGRQMDGNFIVEWGMGWATL